MYSRSFSLLVFVLISFFCFAQKIDVQHYKYEIALNDDNDKIVGKATINVKALQQLQEVELHLVQQKATAKGMKVEGVVGADVKSFRQSSDKIIITLNGAILPNAATTFTITYSGIPADGLIISKNKYGDRTFFSDNWPNRAHNWIPCNDVPADKASVEFLITAPIHYQVISNGIQVEETNINKTTKLTHYKEVIPIPTKVMVIGAAQLAVKQFNDSSTLVPVTGWVYPQDKEKGFYDYALASDILKFFTNYIAPYPFQKLANVQSKTMFGGMENASAIFYSETSVTGNREAEALIAHEIAHQWFGNSASEKTFSHLWLSEGFATYLTHIYLEQKYGRDTLLKRLDADRQEIIDFARTSNMPVVDNVSSYMDLLNANSYQKGGWVLHMLRNEVGDKNFQKIIQTYYNQFKGGNADTRDFQKVAEQVSGKDLKWFFDQWLYKPGVPQLTITEKMIGNDLRFEVIQGNNVFRFPLEIMVVAADGEVKTHRFEVTQKSQKFTVNTKGPAKVTVDPNRKLLFLQK